MHQLNDFEYRLSGKYRYATMSPLGLKAISDVQQSLLDHDPMYSWFSDAEIFHYFKSEVDQQVREIVDATNTMNFLFLTTN